jgi:ABC-type amino acid transport substrate-binding protein
MNDLLTRRFPAEASPRRAVGALIRALAGLLALTVGMAAAENRVRVRIGVEANSPPLSFTDAAGMPDGFSAEWLREVGQAGGIEFELVPGPWKTLLERFHARTLDALANVMILDERRATMAFSIGHASVHGVSYTRPDAVPIRTTAQFAGRKMAALNGTISLAYALRHDGWGATIEVFERGQDVLAAVQRGDCDFALLTRSLSVEHPDELGLRRDFVEDIVHPFHIAVHPEDRVVLERINQAIADVHDRGAFHRIYARWIGPIEPRALRRADVQPYALPVLLVSLAIAGIIGWQRWNNRRLDRQAAALQVSQQHYQSLFRNMPNGFANCRMIWDAGRAVDYVYLEVNGIFETLTGKRGVTGRRASEVIPEVLRADPELLEIFGRVASTGQPVRFERFRPGLQRWFAISAASQDGSQAG